MWERSQVEKLTGLSRHMIQDLCYHNTKSGGLGFWEPAVSKPGYSRFDEGDLLAFYLVRQLMKAGFTLKEIESAVFDLMEDDDSFERALRRKATVLHRRRAELDSKLSVLEYLEVAATAATDDRLYAVMEVALTQSAADGRYAKKDGSNATGTWPVSISGNAASADISKYLYLNPNSDYHVAQKHQAI